MCFFINIKVKITKFLQTNYHFFHVCGWDKGKVKRLPSNGMETSKRRWTFPSVLWIPVIICGTLLFVVDIFQTQYVLLPNRLQIQEVVIEQDDLNGYLIKTPGCRIPYLDPFEQSIKEFVYKEKHPVCNDGIPALFDSNLTSIFLVKSSLFNYTDQDVDALKCCYRPFYRAEPEKDDADNQIRFEKRCYPFSVHANIRHEFIKVECHVNQTKVYTDFFSFVPVKSKKRQFEQQPLNVLILGIDAVSRVNFHRQMPRSVEFLQNISAVELLGYNKVGDNTFPNLIPVLTGLSEAQLQATCWNDANGNRFDACPFIWKDFKARGFVTGFGEDSAWMGIFNYMRKGFRKQPTDYMWGPFNRISENQIGNSHNMNVEECVGAREVYKVFVEYITRFVTRMHLEQSPYFGFFWGASLSHDYLNKPNLGDADYRDLLEFLHTGGHLNNTALIVMSDHGIRWGGIRQTYQGRLEERLPFVFVALPEWYKQRYQLAYANLVRNSKRLTTPFDLHETLKDLLDSLESARNASRAYSLFSEVPSSRTCERAEIAAHWCTCQQSVEARKNETVVVEAASYAVDYMNLQLEGYAQCANLTLNNITDARMMSDESEELSGTKIVDYTIVLQTVPGEGSFEVTLRHTKGHNKTNQFEVMGTISRLNLYGKQSSCITDFHLKLYCYCKSFFGD